MKSIKRTLSNFIHQLSIPFLPKNATPILMFTRVSEQFDSVSRPPLRGGMIGKVL